MRRSLTILLLLGAAVGAPSAASAYWSTVGSPQGPGTAQADVVGAGATPSASVSGSASAVLGWNASTLSGGDPVDGYVVRRYDATSSAEQTVGAGCSGTVSALGCTETGVPVGSWKYTVTPVFSANWLGTESAKSSAITIVPLDTTPPTGGSVDATGLGGPDGRWSSSTTLNLALDHGTDSGSGLDLAGAQLLRATATLDTSGGVNDGACGAYGTFSQVGANNPAATLTDTVPVDGTCFRYAYTVPDNAGNVATFTSPDIKVGLPRAFTSFAVLAAATVTNTGATVIANGDVGVSPGTAITGFSAGTMLNGNLHPGDPVADAAQADLTVTYNNIALMTPTGFVSELGGMTVTPGVYAASAASIDLAGDVTLDAQGNPNAVFVFQAGSTVITAADSHVYLINGARACNVWWLVGSSATISTGTAFAGNIMAFASITMMTGASLNGRAMARTAAVTLDTNAITTPGC